MGYAQDAMNELHGTDVFTEHEREPAMLEARGSRTLLERAAGNLAYLRSSLRSGEGITEAEEELVQGVIDDLEKASALGDVWLELRRARDTHEPMNGHHEGYAVIKEELDELWEVCKRNTHSRSKAPEDAPEELRYRKRLDMRKEAIQVAAMAIRFVEDVCDK